MLKKYIYTRVNSIQCSYLSPVHIFIDYSYYITLYYFSGTCSVDLCACTHKVFQNTAYSPTFFSHAIWYSTVHSIHHILSICTFFYKTYVLFCVVVQEVRKHPYEHSVKSRGAKFLACEHKHRQTKPTLIRVPSATLLTATLLYK